jgi:hypothetical protein
LPGFRLATFAILPKFAEAGLHAETAAKLAAVSFSSYSSAGEE